MLSFDKSLVFKLNLTLVFKLNLTHNNISVVKLF